MKKASPWWVRLGSGLLVPFALAAMVPLILLIGLTFYVGGFLKAVALVLRPGSSGDERGHPPRPPHFSEITRLRIPKD